MLILLPLLSKSTNQSLQSVLSNTTSTILVETQFVSSFKGPRKGGERSQQYLELQSYAKHKHNCGFIWWWGINEFISTRVKYSTHEAVYFYYHVHCTHLQLLFITREAVGTGDAIMVWFQIDIYLDSFSLNRPMCKSGTSRHIFLASACLFWHLHILRGTLQDVVFLLTGVFSVVYVRYIKETPAM